MLLFYYNNIEDKGVIMHLGFNWISDLIYVVIIILGAIFGGRRFFAPYGFGVDDDSPSLFDT